MAELYMTPFHLEKGKSLIVSLKLEQGDSNLNGKDVNLQLLKIDDCELYESVRIVNSKIEHRDDSIHASFKNNLPEGIYLISGFSHQIEGETYRNNKWIESFMRVIQVCRDGDRKMQPTELRDYRNKKVKTFNRKKDSGLGLVNQDSRKFRCFVFLINIYLGKELNLGVSKLIPVERLDNGYIKRYMAEVLKSEGIDITIENNVKKSYDDPYSQPGVLIDIYNVNAIDVEEASRLSFKYAEEMVKSLALINNSHGEILGDVIIDKQDNKVYHRSIYYSYLGNLFVGLENPKDLKRIHQSMDDDLLNYYVSMYLEATKERNLDYKRLKLWTILESMAKNNDYSDKPQILLEGTPIISKRNNKPILIGKESMYQVRELIRTYFTSISREPSVDEDTLNIWYQERNCVAHKGKCLYEDINYCNSRNDKFTRCRIYEATLYETGKRGTDTNNHKLKNLVRDILKFEIKK